MENSLSDLSPMLGKILANVHWIPNYAWQRMVRRQRPPKPFHLVLALADHFEPYIYPPNPRCFLSRSEQLKRVRDWCREYPIVFRSFRDSCGIPFRHTYFYPAEHCDPEIIGILAEHCNRGWGEIEIHLHHGLNGPDTPENTRDELLHFRDFLASNGCLSRLKGSGIPRYAFVHGNWALANLYNGRYCGVDSEMQILAETGCYADFTLPSAPARAQVAKINCLYECKNPLENRGPHRRGRDLHTGSHPSVLPIVIQGPLMIDFSRRRQRILPTLENSALTAINPPTIYRLRLWTRAGITVQGRPEWLFVKLHCHGMDPRDTQALLGNPTIAFLREVAEAEKDGRFITHFVTAREMTNIVLAACDGKEGNPSLYRHWPFAR